MATTDNNPRVCRPKLASFVIEKPCNIDLEEYVVTNVSGSKCNICNQVFVQHSSKLLAVHIYDHLGLKPFACGVCGKESTSKDYVVEHVQRNHRESLGKKWFKCNICDKEFQKKNQFQKHYNMHERKTVFKCEICKKVFYQKAGIYHHHMNVHNLTEKNHLCQFCGLSFNHISLLKSHIRTKHDKEVRFTCSVCSKGFFRRYPFENHLKIHSVERPFTCDICKKNYKTKEAIHKHIEKSHNKKIKSHQCKSCGASFFQPSELKIHEWRHLGIRKYACQICCKTFAIQTNLHTHMHVHSEHKFQCDLCGGKFNRKDNMKAHIIRHATSGVLKKRVEDKVKVGDKDKAKVEGKKAANMGGKKATQVRGKKAAIVGGKIMVKAGVQNKV